MPHLPIDEVHHVPVAEIERLASGVLAEASLVGSVVVFHVVDHKVLPDRYQLGAHVLVGLSAPLAAAALGATVDELGLDPANFLKGVKAGLVAAAISAGVITALSLIPSLQPLLDDPRSEVADRREVWRKLALEIPVGTAVYEELVFRSALFALADRRWPRPAAVIATSTLFGLWHVLPALEDRRHNPVAQKYPFVATVGPTVISTAVAGALFTRLRVKSGHVIAPIINHAVFNSASFLAARAVRHRRGGVNLETTLRP